MSWLLGANALPRYPPFALQCEGILLPGENMKYTTSAKLFVAALIIAFIACSVSLYVVVS